MDDEQKALAKILNQNLGKQVVIRYVFDGESETRYHMRIIPVKIELDATNADGAIRPPRLRFWKWKRLRDGGKWQDSIEWLSELRFMRVVE